MNWIVRLCIAAALAGLVVPPAQADAGPYLRFGAGAGFVDEDSFSGSLFEDGYMGTASIGYNWFFPEQIADLRIELEASYRDNDLESISTIPAVGRARAYSAMVNGLFDFRTTWPFVPYLGAGIGATRIQYDDNGGGLFATIDDHDTVFAYQVMGGFNYNLSSGLALGVEYRFLETENFELNTSVPGAVFRSDYNHHSVMTTLTLGF